MSKFSFSFNKKAPKKQPSTLDFSGPKAISNAEYELIRKVVYEHSRINLGQNKRELVMARLSKRLRALNLPSYKAYCELIQSPFGKDEMSNLIDSISTNHTYFFREISHFDFMEKVILPQFCPPNNKSSYKKTLKIWSAATSSGEEPYSIAILLEEYFSKVPGWMYKIQCTDISTKILAQARAGQFTQEKVNKLSKNRLINYFIKHKGPRGDIYEIKPAIRKNLNFTCMNLLTPRYPFSDTFDIIFCRNVMIYFDRQTQEELVNKMSRLLCPGGYLMIGHAESLTAIKHSLKTIKPAIYQKPQ